MEPCKCLRCRWALPNLVVNSIRLMLTVWGIMHAPPPEVVLHFAVTLMRLAVILWILLGVLL